MAYSCDSNPIKSAIFERNVSSEFIHIIGLDIYHMAVYRNLQNRRVVCFIRESDCRPHSIYNKFHYFHAPGFNTDLEAINNVGKRRIAHWTDVTN